MGFVMHAGGVVWEHIGGGAVWRQLVICCKKGLQNEGLQGFDERNLFARSEALAVAVGIPLCDTLCVRGRCCG